MEPNPVLQPEQNDDPLKPQPGTTVMPGALTTQPVSAPVEVEEASAPTPTILSTLESPEDDNIGTEAAFTWQASEYIHHHKGALWYVALAVIVAVLLGIAVFTQQWLSIAVFMVMGAAIVVYAKKPPRTLSYALTEDGLTIDGRLYSFEQFRSFAVLPDISWHTIDLEPTQRFMPRLNVMFEDADFEQVVGHLAEYLPRVDRKPDLVEHLTRYLRF